MEYFKSEVMEMCHREGLYQIDLLTAGVPVSYTHLQFCKAHFPGHQALICTHPDGHNHSGNIPAHPQKQYTRRWRLYHFCGFYYPIREVIPIAIYHCNIGIVSRGKGKSAVAAAAYRSGEKITNEWDGMTHDYTRKRGVVHTEILLPPHAPPSFSDRAALWNSVELYEKAGNAQLQKPFYVR